MSNNNNKKNFFLEHFLCFRFDRLINFVFCTMLVVLQELVKVWNLFSLFFKLFQGKTFFFVAVVNFIYNIIKKNFFLIVDILN